MIWDIDPVAVTVFGWPIYWYGITYVVGFLVVDWLAPIFSKELSAISYQLSADSRMPKADSMTEKLSKKMWSDLIFGGFLWGVIGGRLGEFVFYTPDIFWTNPLEILQVWHGGMSIHGGLLGAIIFLVWYTRRQQVSFWHVTDSVVIPLAFVLGLGRIANYVNGELVGVPTGTEWGIVFPHVDTLLRHPTQLYESGTMFLLGFLLLGVFVIMKKNVGANGYSPFQVIKNLKLNEGFLSILFLIGYGVFRFLVEFWKDSEPVFLNLKMGQWLCLLMILVGVWLLMREKIKNER